MRFQVSHLVTGLVLPSLVLALPGLKDRSALPRSNIEIRGEEYAPHLRGKRSTYEDDGVVRTVFEHEATGASIDFVTNSGICETTAGVNQYSGYLTVASKLSRH